MTNLPNENGLIHSLPFDVLYTIFHLATENNKQFAISVSHCCTRWRQFAIDTPSLWTTIRFLHARTQMPSPSGITGNPGFDKQRTYLLRSQDLLIDITIGREIGVYQYQILDKHPTFGQKQLNTIMRMLITHVSRWKSLTVQGISFRGFRNVFDRLLWLDAPNLDHLAAEVPPPASRNFHWKFRPFRSGLGMPRLKSLCVGPGIEVEEWSKLSFDSLESFSSSRITGQSWSALPLDRLFHFLSQNPTLKHFSVDLGYSAGYSRYLNGSTAPLISLPSLHTIRLATEDNNTLFVESLRFLLRLHTPELQNLHPSSFDHNATRTLLSAPSISFTKIQEIKLMHPTHEPDIHQILLRFPHLRSFGIESRPQLLPRQEWETQLVEPLCTMLPHLHTLSITTGVYFAYFGEVATIEQLQRICQARSNDPNLTNIARLDVGERSEEFKVSDEEQKWFEQRGIRFSFKNISPC